MNTNWSSPKTNIIAALLDLRQALQSGHPAALRRVRNEDCAFPIKVRLYDTDFRNYKFSSGQPSTVNAIKADKQMTDFQKHLSLNYITAYGTQEAMDRYYSIGVLGADNFEGAGRSHLVNVDDYIKWLEIDNCESGGDVELAKMYRTQYRTPENNDIGFLFTFYSPEQKATHAIKTFKHKLWVVELLDKDANVKVPVGVKILNVVMTPLKYIPKKSVLRMPEYKLVTFRVGDVINGFSVDFHIPKKFGFK